MIIVLNPNLRQMHYWWFGDFRFPKVVSLRSLYPSAVQFHTTADSGAVSALHASTADVSVHRASNLLLLAPALFLIPLRR